MIVTVRTNILEEGWRDALAEYLLRSSRRVHLIGTGNRLRGDDAVGFYIVSQIARKCGDTLPDNIVLHPESVNPELEMSRLDLSREGLVIFDAIESDAKPGTILCAPLSDTRYSFFATHNIPLRMIPSLSSSADHVLVAGIQPLSMELGAGLSREVRSSADMLVEAVSAIIGVG